MLRYGPHQVLYGLRMHVDSQTHTHRMCVRGEAMSFCMLFLLVASPHCARMASLPAVQTCVRLCGYVNCVYMLSSAGWLAACWCSLLALQIDGVWAYGSNAKRDITHILLCADAHLCKNVREHTHCRVSVSLFVWCISSAVWYIIEILLLHTQQR